MPPRGVWARCGGVEGRRPSPQRRRQRPRVRSGAASHDGVRNRRRLVGTEGHSDQIVALVLVVDEGKCRLIRREGRLQGPIAHVRHFQYAVRHGIVGKHVGRIRPVRREEQVSPLRPPAHIVDDGVPKSKPGVQGPRALDGRRCPRQILTSVFVHEHRDHRVARRGRYLSNATRICGRQGPGHPALRYRCQPCEGAVVHHGVHPTGRPLRRRSGPSPLRETRRVAVVERHSLDLHHGLARHERVLHVPPGVQRTGVSRQSVHVILCQRLHPHEVPCPGRCVNPIEPAPHVVAVQIRHQRLLVDPVRPPVIPSLRPGDERRLRERRPALHLLLIRRP